MHKIVVVKKWRLHKNLTNSQASLETLRKRKQENTSQMNLSMSRKYHDGQGTKS
uniref:Uncharacterized protein n=1 Tax=Rhizophora mucronata TaxID=61149 RepID=A0A2P2Q9Y3_RHIMU